MRRHKEMTERKRKGR